MARNFEFLHGSILGDNAGVLEARSFGTVTTGAIGLPTYRSKYFETFPSMWANAYAFSKLLKLVRVSKVEAYQAIGEWVSMFALHYLGIAHVEEYSRQEIVTECDPDFWPAMAGTYPDPASIESLILLVLDAQTVLGAYYPEVVFFPARGRERWGEHPRLRGFLENGALSWEKVSALLTRGNVVRDFEVHLRSIAASCLSGDLQKTLLTFCDNQFKGNNVAVADLLQLSPSPAGWRLPSAAPAEAQTTLLERYPLKQPNSEGGTTYYLLAGIDGGRVAWINAPIGPHLPAPADFRRSGDRQIAVQFAGQTHLMPIGESDRIVLLTDLLLKADAEPYWTRFAKSASDFAAKVRPFHRIEPSGAPGIFAGTQDDAIVICLAPLTTGFVREFPMVLNEDGAITTMYDRAADKLRWTVTILGRQIPYDTSAVFCRALADSSVAVWPSKSSPDWRIYAAKGTGYKQSYGRWILVDEAGAVAERIIDIEDDEYVTVLYNEKRPCQPRAILLKDASDNERGLLVLAPLQRAVLNQERKPSLAIDFGTSNTCLASRNATGEPATLTFDHAPMMAWGKRLPGETPGFVPFKWGGKRGYYPSIVLSLIRARQPSIADLKPEHLFTVDIPSLHDQLDGVFLRGTFTGTWAVHTNLKWERDPNAPWRACFLALSLLYAHAEMFMRDGAIPSTYVFTFPLAFSETKRQAFHADNRALVAMVRKFCFGDTVGKFQYVDTVDESRAIAKSAQAMPNPGIIELFIDVGGGTADVAIRHGGQFLVLDSIRVAGRAFFHFTERNLRQQLLASEETLQQLVKFNLETLADRGLDRLNELNIDLGTAYSVSMNGLDEGTFTRREGAILDATDMPSRSYQRYRSQLFFRHVLTYALLQACAAAADHKLPIAEGGINIICSGNGWGLLVFAHLHRSRAEIRKEAERILESIKDELIRAATQDEAAVINAVKIFGVNLMNERALREAKTFVAIGALRAAATPAEDREDRGSTAPYIGMTLSNVVVNDAALGELRWCSRWAKRDFASRANADEINTFRFDASPAGTPIAPVLTLFSKLGNTSNRAADQLSAENWGFVNGAIREAYVQNRDLERSPINFFVSDVLYPDDDEHVILDELARINRSFRA
jgi:hypothetical protein